jgi:mRNA-degrading endonuclease RelE of RelBE toxin-antitoxin system
MSRAKSEKPNFGDPIDCPQRRSLDNSSQSGYHLARMRHEIILSPEAAQDLRRLAARERATVRDALEAHLRHEPTKLSKSRIKRLRGMAQPQYRLRVGDLRVFYDLVGEEVRVLAIVAKADADIWLKAEGKTDEDRGSLGG